MTNTESLGGEQFDQNRVVSAFDRRHPTQADYDYLTSVELPQMQLSKQYEDTRVVMDAFFKSRNIAPPGEDESY